MSRQNKHKSIYKRQKDALLKMMNFNTLVSNITSIHPQWKILIYDDFSRQIIAPHVSLKELRRLGVTLHLGLLDSRETIPEVLAIYFVQPTEENIAKICTDMRKGMYQKYYLHFTSSISRKNLEFLADTTVRTSTDHLVSKVFDQYLNFMAKSSDLFTLSETHASNMSLFTLNNPTASDTVIENSLKSIVDGLLSFFVTSASIPIIRCYSSSEISRQISTLLDEKFRDSLSDTRSCVFACDPVYGTPISFQRPLLLVVDRTADVVSPLLHSSTYEALLHDALEYNNNSVRLRDVNGRNTTTHVLDEDDAFWGESRHLKIDSVAGKMNERLSQFKMEEERLREFTKQNSEKQGDLVGDNMSTVKDLTDLLGRKKLVEMHTEIGSCLLKHIEARKLNVFYEMEKNYKDCVHSKEKSLLALMESIDGGNQTDLHRFLAICSLCDDSITQSEIQEAAEKFNIPLNQSIAYIRKFKSHARLSSMSSTSQFDIKSVAGNVLDKLITEGARFLGDQKKGVPLIDMIDKLIDLPPQNSVLQFDPKSTKVSNEKNLLKRVNFSEIVVFVIGGGCYIEYEAISRYKIRRNKNIIYGSTVLYPPNEFLEQLNKLGEAYSASK